MCWVGVVDGRVLPIHWFEENGSCVNGDSYLDMLKTVVWPSVSRTAKRKKFWFQHTLPQHQPLPESSSTISLRTVISRRSEFIRPSQSPDLNPLDYRFWVQVKREVSSGSPENIESLKEVVQRSARLTCRTVC